MLIDTTNKTYLSLSLGEHIGNNYISDKVFVSRIYKQFLYTVLEPINNLQNNLNGHFMEEEIKMVNKCMERCLTSILSYLGNAKYNKITEVHTINSLKWQR